MKKLLFVMVMGVLILTFTGCKGGSQSPSPTQQVQPKMLDKKIVVFDFWAPWCSPCRAFTPTFEAWKQKYSSDHVEFKKVNVDEETELATEFKISSIPCVVVTVNGKETKRWYGAPKESDVLEHLK